MKTNSYDKLEEIDIYFREIKKYKPLNRKREAELSKRIQRGDENALNELVNANLRFVVSVAKKYRSSGVPFHDLIAEGNIGLIKAARKFDADKGVKFISYAVWWVKSAIQDCIVSATKGDEFQSDEYNTIMCRDAEFEYNPHIINEEYENDLVNLSSRRDAIDELMATLSERETKILLMYYGLDGGEECTLDKIGKEMNLTKERVRQIKDNALSKMKVNALMSEEFDSFNELR